MQLLHTNSVRKKAPSSVSASKRKHKNQINHCDKKDEYLTWPVVKNTTVGFKLVCPCAKRNPNPLNQLQTLI